MEKSLRFCCLGFITVFVIIIFSGMVMADIDQETTLTTHYRDAHGELTNEVLLSELHQGDILNVRAEVLDSGPLNEIMLQKWTCINMGPSRTNCGWPGFFEGSTLVSGDPHYYNVGKTTFSKTISEPGSYRLYLIGSTANTKVYVKITAKAPTPTPTLTVMPTKPTPKITGFEAILVVFVIALLVIWRRR